MRLRRFAAVLVSIAASFLAGCFQSSTLVKLNPDGSGTVEQTLTMTAQAFSQLQGLASMGDKDKKGKPDDPFSVDQAKAAAAKMGTGVTFVSADKIDTPERKGLRAVYAFKDIRTISLSEMHTPPGADMGAKPEKPMAVTFAQLPNGHALLTLKNDTDAGRNLTTPGAGGAGQSPLGGLDNAQAAEMMKSMLAGMKIDFAVQVGRVVKTNIPYVSGGTVTLLSMDFDQVLSNPAALEKLQKAKSLADTKTALQGLKGIKVSLDPELTIEFTK
jgi:hypothetical protein